MLARAVRFEDVQLASLELAAGPVRRPSTILVREELPPYGLARLRTECPPSVYPGARQESATRPIRAYSIHVTLENQPPSGGTDGAGPRFVPVPGRRVATLI